MSTPQGLILVRPAIRRYLHRTVRSVIQLNPEGVG